jgi:hypothetical protein
VPVVKNRKLAGVIQVSDIFGTVVGLLIDDAEEQGDDNI